MHLEKNILFTGGRGLLGGEMKKLIPEAYFPTHEEFDIRNYFQMEDYVKEKRIELLIHAAAVISPPVVKNSPLEALETNIIGTSNIVKLASQNNFKLIYISTDYVFNGNKGNYREDDEVLPVNKYSWSKLGGECAVRMYDNSLIIRTSFGPNEFPFPKAFADQWTSRESVSLIAKKVVSLLDKDILGIIHIGGKRRTVFEYANDLSPSKDIGKLYIKEVPFEVPRDTSLDCTKYKNLMMDKK